MGPGSISKDQGRLVRDAALLALLLVGASACRGAKADISLSKAVQSEDEEVVIENVPVPAEDGPKMLALKSDVPVLERPKKDATVVGALRFGGAVARAAEPIKRTPECEGGYYPVRPRGFVCADSSVSLDATSELVPAPDASRALPYRYATVKSASPLYARLPTAAEQTENEPSLDRHLSKAAKAASPSLRAGANDVPLDERGVASGSALIAKNGQGVGEDGKRTAATFFDLPAISLPALADRAGAPVVSLVLRKGSGVALVATVTGESSSGPRRFGMTPDGLFVPLDRLDPSLGSIFHGVDLTKEEKSLPLGFVLRHEVCPYALSKGKAEKLEDEELERRTPIFLTGRFRTVNGVKYEEAEDGKWLRDKDLIKVIKRSKFPDFVSDGVKWIDVSLALQTMTLYEGKKPIYTTLVSSGRDMLGDPATTASTMQGTFSIARKGLTVTVDPSEVDQAYDVLDAPWSLEFSPGYSIVSTYAGEPSGEARGYHNVTISPLDGHRVFTWAGAEVPTGFRWFAPKSDESITIHVRK